jgi:hypothetical protein
MEAAMQRPFQITPEMEAELNEEITRLTTTHDPTRTRPSPPSFQRRDAEVSDSKGAEAMQEHDQTSDAVNHPKHYNSHPSGVECITVTEWMNFNLGNAVKYIWRAGDKGAQVQDLEKARWYLDREIGRLKRIEK